MPETLNICFFGDAAAHHLRRWSRFFCTGERNHQVHVVTFNANILEGYDPVRVHLVRKRFSGSGIIPRTASLLPMLLDIRRLLGEIQPDVIHAHSAAGYAWMAAFSGFHPFVITPWGDDVLIHAQQSPLDRFLTVYALNKADAITCDGENTRQAMVDFRIPAGKISFITFGVDVKIFAPAPVKAVPRSELSLPDGHIVLSTRTLNPIHNVETLIRAITTVRERIPNTFFVIIGDGPEKERLVILARELGILDHTRFAGQVSEQQMISYLQAADIYVSTSVSESGLAASTAEAMACELPVINTDTGDIRLWIRDGEDGIVVPVRSSETLADRIIDLLSDPAKRETFGKAGRLVIEERNNYYKEMEKMECMYLQTRRR